MDPRTILSRGVSTGLRLGRGTADRVVTLAGPVPVTADFDWYAGMVAPGGPRTATEGREARARYAETEEFDENSFTAADYAALAGAWASLGEDAGRAGRAGPDGLIDDDVALMSPWGFDPTQITTPVLLVHGGEDRVIPVSHSQWLVRRLAAAEPATVRRRGRCW